MSSLINNKSVFVDCGANVGLWTCNIARLGRIYPGLRIKAFEANPDTYSRLQRSVGGLSNVEAFCCALSDREQELKMFGAAGSCSFGVDQSVFNIAEDTKGIWAKPLDSFLGGLENVVIKVDVEGHELEVLRGAADSLRRGAVTAVYIDGHARGKREEILSILAAGGLVRVLDGRTLEPLSPASYAILALAPVSGALSKVPHVS